MTVLLPHKRVKIYGVLALLFCLGFLFCGCASTTPSINDHVETMPPINPEIFIRRIAHFERNILKAIAKIEARSIKGHYSTKAALLVKRPSFFRFEAIPIIGPVNVFLSVHDDTLKIFFSQAGKFYIGKAKPDNFPLISGYFPEGLCIEDLLSIMMGAYPPPREKVFSLRSSQEGARYRIDMMKEDGKTIQALWVNIAEKTLSEVQVFNEENKVVYTVRYGEFNRSPDDLVVPSKITITSEAADHAELIIRYSDIQFITEIDESVFDLPIPPGIQPIVLD
jgi:hypothetical protein